MNLLDKIKSHALQIDKLTRHYHFKNLTIIGSVARGQEGPNSDIDFIAEPILDENCTLFDLHDLERELTTLLGREVDICTPKGFHWYAFQIDPGQDANKRQQIKYTTLAIELVERLENIERYTGNDKNVFLSNPLIQDAVLCNMHIIMALGRTLPDHIFQKFFWYERHQTVKNQDPEIMWNSFAKINQSLRNEILNYLGVESIEQIKSSLSVKEN